jgi:hypothetical protein
MRPDTGAVAVSLSELQKIGHELAASSGNRSVGGARLIYRRQVSITHGEGN